jgi:hypothetical protein
MIETAERQYTDLPDESKKNISPKKWNWQIMRVETSDGITRVRVPRAVRNFFSRRFHKNQNKTI